MDANYQPSFSVDVQIDDTVKKFVADFYRVSDDPRRDEEWLAFFQRDATFILAGKASHGPEELRELRQHMWRTARGRRHGLLQAFTGRFSAAAAGNGSVELMLVGTVDLVLEPSGEQREAHWVGHMRLAPGDEGGGVLKISYYRVYIN